MRVCLPESAKFKVVRPMSRQIGPWSAEPLAVMLEWRLRELDARLRAIESQLEDWRAEHADAAEEQTVNAGAAD